MFQQENPKQKKLSGMSSPQPMIMSGNLSQQWKKWVQSFKFYLRASGMDEESDGRKVALFLHAIGEKGVAIFNTFGKNEDLVKYEELIELFQNHFAPKANLTYECHNFFTYKQGENETLDDFACSLKLRSQNCELGQLQERLIKSMFICNMHQKYNYIREKLLLEDKLDLDKALEMAKAMLASRLQTDQLAADQGSVLYNKCQRSRLRSKSKSRNGSQPSHSQQRHSQQSHSQESNKICTRCAQIHRHKCPAQNAKCRKCEKIGHFAVCCRSFQSRSVRYVQSDRDMQQVQSEPDELFVGHIQSSKSLSNEWIIYLQINGVQIKCIIDTGSDVNIMSKNVYDSLNIQNSLSKTCIKIKSYTGNSLEVLGQQNLKCKFQLNDSYMSKQINFIIANVNSPTVLGKATCTEIGLIKRVFCVDTTNMQTSDSNGGQLANINESKSSQVLGPNVTNILPSQSQSFTVQSSQSQNIDLNKLLEFNNSVFNGLGCLPGELQISTNPEVKPKVDAPRKVPFALHNRLKQELEKMVKMDVILQLFQNQNSFYISIGIVTITYKLTLSCQMAPVVEPVTEPVWLGEGPHWDHTEQVLYFVSIFDNTVNKYVPATGKHTKAKLDGMPTFIIPVEGRKNHFVIGLNRKVVEIQWSGEEDGAKVVRTVAEVDEDNPQNRFNDAKADPKGRLFAGTMGYEYEPGKFHLKKGSLYRIDPDGSVHKLDSNIDISNGLCWDLKEKAFYFADSFEYTIRRYDYDVETGDISNPRNVFAYKDHGLDGIVDGMTIDTDGNLWVANFDGNQVLKIDPKAGKLLQKVPIPALQVTSATFGGPNFDILYVTSASMNRGAEQKPPCGATFKVTGLGVKGHPNVNVRLN